MVLVLAAGFGQETAEFATFLSAFREEFGEKCRALSQALGTRGKMK